MRSRSLRLRLLVAATCAVALALAIAGLGLVVLFERHVERRIGAELDTYLNQLAAHTVFAADGSARLDGTLADPRFSEVYSGLYWQIADEAGGGLARSRSLWDTELALPDDRPPLGVVDVHDIDGPRGARLLTHERRLVFDTGQGEKVLRLSVAIDRADVTALSADFASDVVGSLVLLAAVLILAGWIQVNVGLKPLAAIRRGLTAVRSGASQRLEADVPSEISPLVEEVNDLLEAQDRAMARARDRAADLAHGFKTPLTALLADAGRLRERGQNDIAAEIERTARLMRGHIDRELARSRVRNMRASSPVDVAGVVDGLIATLKRTPEGERIDFEAEIEPGVAARAERDDLNEVLGNLLENAARHAKGRVRIAVARADTLVRFSVEDDGPGIADAEHRAVVGRGRRLDTSDVGAGLGLAIVSDVLDHYGRGLSLGRSGLGGLSATFDLDG